MDDWTTSVNNLFNVKLLPVQLVRELYYRRLLCFLNIELGTLWNLYVTYMSKQDHQWEDWLFLITVVILKACQQVGFWLIQGRPVIKCTRCLMA